MPTRTRGTPFKRDFRDQEWREPDEGYLGPEPEKGLYPMVFVNANEHEAQNGNVSTRWVFSATEEAASRNGDDSYEGWRGYMYTNDEGAAFREQEILVALGAMKPNGTISTTLEGLVKKYRGTVVMGKVARERYIPEDGGEGEWRAKLVTVIKQREDGDTGGKRRKRSRDDDVDEVEEPFEDEVEEEEERPTKRAATSRRRRKAEPEPEPEEEEPEDEVDIDAIVEDLESLSLTDLKKAARTEYGISATDLRGKKEDDIIDMIVEELEAETEEEEPEPEPEPEPTRRRRGSRTSAAKKGSSGRGRARTRGDSSDPPF